jgi:hypothetical protein
MMTINLTLEKYAAKETVNVQLKAWTREMHELANGMEDTISLFIHHFTHHVDLEPANNTTGVKKFFPKRIRKLKKLHYRCKFDKEIQELCVLINKAYERRETHYWRGWF